MLGSTSEVKGLGSSPKAIGELVMTPGHIELNKVELKRKVVLNMVF